MRQMTKCLVLTLLLVVLVGCAPGETLPDPAEEPPAPADTATVAPMEATTEPAQPTETRLPAPTATATRLALEITPAQPTKAIPNEVIAPMPPEATAEPPSDPYALELIELAKTDLSRRTRFPQEELELLEFRYVTWPNTALGCPQPGMGYADVLVDGYFIILRAGSDVYYYHGGSGRSSNPFLCEGIDPRKILPPPSIPLDQ